MIVDKRLNPTPARAATINDVAELAGTSIATVSRVLNGSGYPVSEKTRQRVLDAARQLQYTPNLLGHMLKAKTNKCLGIIIPSFQNPFFTQLVMGIEHAARSRGYSTFVFSSQRDVQTERELISQLQQLRISGLLLSATDHDNSAISAYLDSGACAAIFESDYPPDPRAIDATCSMDENGYIATSALIESGHRRIAFMTTPLTKHNRQMVSKGFRQAMSEHGLPVCDDDIFVFSNERELDNGLFEFEAGRELAQQLIHSGRGYTAVIAVNDLLACGIIRGLTSLGVRIPQDVSIVGIDDIPQCVIISPMLTTVNQGNYHHGYEVCMKLIERLESGKTTLNQRCYRKPELVMRESIIQLEK